MPSLQAILQSERALAWASTAATAVVVVMIAYSLATLTWQVAAPASTAMPEVEATANVQPEQAGKTRNHALQIAKLHLFGEAKQSLQADKAPEAPETKLNLTLLGVYATGGDDAMAIIDRNSNNESFYHVGEPVAGGAKLESVHADRVILARNGQLETLRLPKSKAEGIELAEVPPPADGHSPTGGQTSSGQAGNVGAASSGGKVDLGKLRKNMLDNPGQLGNMVRATPYQRNGEFVGYRLSPRRHRQLFEQLGLEAGDVVTSVNGIAIDRPDKGLLALQDLIKADEVNLTLLRDGNEVTVQRSIGEQ